MIELRALNGVCSCEANYDALISERSGIQFVSGLLFKMKQDQAKTAKGAESDCIIFFS